MNPAEVALAQLDVLLDEQEAAATPPGPPAAACPTRRRIGNPTNEAPASLPAAAAAALRRRREHQPAAAPPAEPAEPEEQPAQLRCSKRLRVAPAPVAEFAAGAEVEALWETKWHPGVVAEVIVEQDGVYYEIAWADGYYQNRIRALSRSGEKLVRRRASAAAPLTSTDPAGNPKRPAQSLPPVVTSLRPAARPPPPRGAYDWCVLGTHVQDAEDATVRGVVIDIHRGHREVTTTTGAVVMLKLGQLTRATLTAEEAARCIRPAAKKDYVQARIDGAIRLSHGGREFKNRYTCADGTERRQFEVTATHVRCVLCGDAYSWPLEKECNFLVGDVKQHCGTQKHLDRLVQSAGAPPPTAEAFATPAPTPAAPAPPPPRSQNVRPQAVAASQRFAVDDLVQADFHARGAYYDGVVVAARADGGNGFLYRVEYDDGDDEDDVPEERIKHLDTATR